MKQLIIETSRWLRGKDAWVSNTHTSNNSRLLRPNDNKMCCLGFYLKSCGVPEKDMLDVPSPKMVVRKGVQLPEEAAWLVCPADLRPTRESPTCKVDSEDCSVLMRENDDRDYTEEHRREQVKAAFAKHDVEVVFQD